MGSARVGIEDSEDEDEVGGVEEETDEVLV